MDKRKLIITAALTGAAPTLNISPFVPITPEQIADEAVRSYNAGAAVVHIHVRDPKTGKPASGANREEYIGLFREALTKIKSQCNVACCLSTGGSPGMTTAERISVVPALRPELCSFNCGSLTFRGFRRAQERIKEYKYPWEKEFMDTADNIVYDISMASLKQLSKVCDESGTRPELEIYEVGMIDNVAFLIDNGYLKPPIYLQFVMGFLGGIASSPKCLNFLYETCCETFSKYPWLWSALGTGRRQMMMCNQALLLGSTGVRVGLEDSVFLPDGSLAKGNAEQVEKIIRIAREFGIEPATPDEARAILGLKGLDKVNW
jgi:uncharacterized protein (DUF849 family)